MGNAVEMLATYPEEFDEYFFVSDELDSKPGNSTLSVVKLAYDKALARCPDFNMRFDSEELKPFIVEACNEDGFGGSWPDERKYETILKKGEIYFNSLLRSRGKVVLSSKQRFKAQELANKLLEHNFTGWLFTAKNMSGVEFLVQQPVYRSYRDHTLKGLIDILIINNNDYTVYLETKPIPARSILAIDIKTIGDSVKAFPKSVLRRRYDVQASFYTHIIQGSYEGYTMLPFLFMVVSTSTNEHPLIYKTYSDILRGGRYGWIYDNGWKLSDLAEGKDLDLLGFEQMIYLYEWHEQYGYEYDKYIYEQNGILKLEI